jgi:hypothetical protein
VVADQSSSLSPGSLYAVAFAALAILPLFGAGIAWRAQRREAAASMATATRVSRRSGAAR